MIPLDADVHYTSCQEAAFLKIMRGAFEAPVLGVHFSAWIHQNPGYPTAELQRRLVVPHMKSLKRFIVARIPSPSPSPPFFFFR